MNQGTALNHPLLSPEELRHLLDDRPLYLWGAAQAGVGMFFALQRSGIEVTGFLDRRQEMQGKQLYGRPVHNPTEILKGSFRSRRPFLIHTTFQHKDELKRMSEAAALNHIIDYVPYDELNPIDYQVVISGVCNLKCISCPLGNMPKKEPAGMMSSQTYELVLNKILLENPFIGIIQLYNWGEPLLNPDLPEIIKLTNEHKVLCAVSSNLSLSQNLGEVIRARPGCFRVSLSGWGETYAITHTRGKWDIVQANMEYLEELRQQYCPEMPVEVTYHIYRHNHEDAPKIRDLCERLNFIFRPHFAALLPLDNIVAYDSGDRLTTEAYRTIDMLMINIDEALRRAALERRLSCNFEHAINIDWDLTVKHCGLYYSRTDNVVANSYLTTSLEDILAQRRTSRLCHRCRKQGLHRFCRIYTDELMNIAA